jgi:hypothetical protein
VTSVSCLGWDFQNAWANGTKSGNDSCGWAKLVSAVANNYQLAQQMNLPPSQKRGVNDLGPYLQKSLEHLIRNLAAGYDDISNSVIDPAK